MISALTATVAAVNRSPSAPAGRQDIEGIVEDQLEEELHGRRVTRAVGVNSIPADFRSPTQVWMIQVPEVRGAPTERWLIG